jgi:hypothetical protein
MKRLLTICFLALAFSGLSQEPAGNALLTMAGYTPAFADAFSQQGNASVLASLRKRSAGIYSEQRFMIAEWKTVIAAAALPTRSGNFGCCLSYSGTENYAAIHSSLAYARNFGSRIDAGLQFHYSHAAMPGYTALSGIGYSVSLLFHLNEKFSSGIQFSSPPEQAWQDKTLKKLPEKFGFGLGYKVSELVFLTSEITKEKNAPVNFNAGLHYAFHEKIFFRVAITSATSSWQLGAGIRWKQCRLLIMASVHPVLGATPGLLLMVEEKTIK